MSSFTETVTNIYGEGMSITNLNITKVAAFFLILFGLYVLFDSYEDARKSRDSKRVLAIITIIIGGAYFIYTGVGAIRLLTKRM